MSRGVRLPTLYPMPRDRSQYWDFFETSLNEPTTEEFEKEVGKRLTRESDGRPYSQRTIVDLVTNLIRTGFLRRSDGQILPPDSLRFGHDSWDGRSWDGSHLGFEQYVSNTILKWGWQWPDLLQLAYDLLTVLDNSDAGLGLSESWEHLKIDSPQGSGRYDGRDRHGTRTVGETLRLMEFAGWVERSGRTRVVTAIGRLRRSNLRDRDVYHRIESILRKVDPMSTRVFDRGQWIELTKVFMWRECGGKGRWKPIRRAHQRLFSGRYRASLRNEIENEIGRGKRALTDLRSEIAGLNASIGRRVENLRSEVKLQRIRDALQDDREQQAELILDSSGAGFSRRTLLKLKHGGRDYTLAPDLVPHRWQGEALDCWSEAGGQGVLQVVTGAGKTFLAFLAIEQLLREHPALRVSVLVPTKVLMYQWVAELVRILGVPPDDIGLRGDGHKDSFREGCRIVVNIVNSAILDDQMKRDVDRLPADTRHLLIADECHRYRGREFRRVFDAQYHYSIGLSATPGDSLHATGKTATSGGDDPLLAKLGPVVYNYTYRQAKVDGVVQPFAVHYIGVDLSTVERHDYDAYSKRIRTALTKIRQRYGPRIDAMPGPLYASLHTILRSDESPDPAISQFFRAVRERKELVYKARNRTWAYLDVVSKHTVRKEGADDRIIVFDERIENVEEIVAPVDRRKKGTVDPTRRIVNRQLCDLFFDPAFRPVMYHSGRSKSLWNEISMEFFRQGLANVMLSVKALVEGIDVPAANVGIIRASSSSVRQRIQTTGRILRLAAGKNRAAQLYVIYVRETTDERIFRGTDWEEQLGSSDVRWIQWYPPTDRGSCKGQWREVDSPSVVEWEEEALPVFDVERLVPGDLYPGAYAGREFHVDAAGRPFKKGRHGRRRITTPEVVAAALLVLKLKRGGKFVITPENHIITRVGRKLMFLGIVEGTLEFESAARVDGTRGDRPPTFDELFGLG